MIRRLMLGLAVGLVCAVPSHADCGIGDAIDSFNQIVAPDGNDWKPVLKLIINQLNDPHHDMDFNGCSVPEMKKADGFMSDYIDLIKHIDPPSDQRTAAIDYANSVRSRLQDAISR